MKAIFIQDIKELDAQYERLLPLFERVPSTPEYTPRQLFERAKQDQLIIGYCEDERGEAVIAFAFEFIYYPSITSINIIALAGDHFIGVSDWLLDRLKYFARLAGADCIEALCSESMARLLKRHGFKQSNIQVRTGV